MRPAARCPALVLERPATPTILLGLLTLLTCLLSAWTARADEDEGEVPEFLTLLDHGDIEVSPGWTFDGDLQRRLDAAVTKLGYRKLADQGKLGVALVDLTGSGGPKLAEINGADTVYAASVPKIAVLYAAFQARKEGRLRIDDAFRETLTQMVRVSSNSAASAAVQKVGFNYIASVLWQSRLYDPEMGGGLWVGKAYGGTNDYWHRDPVAGKSHAASPVALARMLTLLAQDRLVDAQASREMKEILGNPGLHHKFVKGLDCRPGSVIYRKSGTWSLWHGDAALVERGPKRYVAVALCETPEGQDLLKRIIVEMDDCVGGACAAPTTTMASAAARTTPSTPSGPRGF